MWRYLGPVQLCPIQPATLCARSFIKLSHLAQLDLGDRPKFGAESETNPLRFCASAYSIATYRLLNAALFTQSIPLWKKAFAC
jgi:hypothetical protein